MKLLRVVEWAAAAALSALAWLTPAAAQAPPPRPNPDLGLIVAGTVSAIARQPDGGLIVGGSFGYVGGQPRGNIARIRPDGTLDPDWHPQVASTINALAVNPATGAVYVGGFLTAVDGVARSRLAKLDGATGALDPDWNPAPNSTVSSLAVDPVSGAVFAGGAFSTIGTPAVARLGLAKIAGAGSGAIDATWTPAAKAFSSVNAMALSSGGALYVGGTFTTITSAGSSTATTRNYLARIDATSGVLDAAWDPSASASVSALALDAATGDVYAAGNFTTIGVPAVSRQRLAKIAGGGIGAVDAAFSPAAGSSVYALAFDPAENELYVGGAFTTLAGSGDPATTARQRLGKFDAVTGALDGAWNPAASGSVSALAFGAANTLVAGGNFGAIGATTRLSLATLATTDGALAGGPDVGAKGSVSALARQSDGGLIVGGNFLLAGTAPRTHLLRLKPDGTLDPDFKPVLSSNVSRLAIGAGDAVYLAGYFTTVDGIARQNIAKLDAAGAVVTGWNLASLSGPPSVMVEGGGALYIGGSFTLPGAARLVKLDAATGDRDVNWAPAPNGLVNALALDTTAGALYVAGGFSAIGGASRSYLARLDLATATAAAWNPIVNSSVSALALDGGALYAGGAFVTATVGGNAGVARNRLIKIDAASGDVDANWNPGSSTNVVALAADGGALYVSAGTGTVGGETRAYLSKIATAGTGAVDPLWNPSPDAQVNAFAAAAASLQVGGTFAAIGSTPRLALAALPPDVASTTTITSVQPATTVVGESYTVAVTVGVPGGGPIGSVSIDDGNGAACSAALSGGSGSCALASTAAGTRTLTASHTGSGYASSSATASHLVEAATTTTAFAASTPTTAVYGETVTASFTLAVGAPGAGTPGGDVEVQVDGGAGCTAPASAGACTIPASALAVGTHALVARYAGDADFAASSSAAQNLSVTKAASTTTLLGANPAAATVGQTVTFDYAVGGAGTFTGGVSVIASSGETCSGTLAAGQCQITFATPGARTVTAAYAGDANHEGSSSSALAYTVGNAEVWIEGEKLTPPDGNNGGYFGGSAVVRGDVALVGSEYATVNGVARRGAVYVFRRIDGSWTRVQKLLAGDGATDHGFGASITIEGNTALIGAKGVTVSGASGAGAVYVFTEADGVWTQTQKLTAADPYPAANFGNALSLNGDRVVIGAQNLMIVGRAYQGAAYLFTRAPDGSWSQTQKIVAADGAANAYFGTAIAFDGNRLAITAPSADIGSASRQGAAYLFSEAAPGQWAQVQKLTSSDGYAQQHFGVSVALSGGDLLVGTTSAAINGLTAAGAVYAFVDGGSGWSETQKLISPNPGAYYNFGQRAVLHGDTGFIGESYAAVGGAAQRGAVHAIRKLGGQWSITSTLTASDGAVNNWFGWSIGWDGATAVIGAIGVNYLPNAYQGAVYFFRPDALFSDGFE